MPSSGIPEFLALFKIFDLYLNAAGLREVHLREKTMTKSDQVVQHFLFFITVGSLCHAEFCETLYLVFSARDIKVEDFLVFSEVISCNFCSCMALLKVATLGLGRERVVILTDKLRELYGKENNEDEKAIVNDAIGPAVKLITWYTAVTMILAGVYNTFNMVNGIVGMIMSGNDWIPLPYSFYYFYDPRQNIVLYVFCYVMEMHAGFATGFGIVIFDGFCCLVLTHLSMHFEVLCYNIRQIGVHPKDITDEDSEVTDTARVKEIVMRHTSLLGACELANDVFGFPLLVNISLASILNCGLLFCVSISPMIYFIKYFLFMASSLTQLFMISYYGEKLKSASSDITVAAYECNWLQVGPKIRKSLMIITSKGLQYTSLSAMGFTQISMLTFMSVLKVSMSYFTLLKTIYEKAMAD